NYTRPLQSLTGPGCAVEGHWLLVLCGTDYQLPVYNRAGTTPGHCKASQARAVP
ncbi:hypothetical protein J6590_085828, partial [Homalodisca vitripennis]